MRIGTSSWSSKDWVGPFYPHGTKPQKFIEHYGTIFDTVEIDATFYRMPSVANVNAWRDRSPPGFKFAVKAPRVLTHDKVLVDVDDELCFFIDTIAGLEDRLGPILFQFPYFNRKVFTSSSAFFSRLESFLCRLPEELRFAVEIRNKNWVGSTIAEICRANNVALAWVEQAWMPRAGEWFELTGGPTSDFAYIRWLGDRKAIEKVTSTWDKLAVDRTAQTNAWIPVIRRLRESNVAVFGYFNNHFAGHAPASARLLATLMQQEAS